MITPSPYRSVSDLAPPTRSTGSHGRTDGRTNEDRPSFTYESLLCVTREKGEFSTLVESAGASRGGRWTA